MYFHIVFVLLYSVCRSVSVLLSADVIQSFTYGLRVFILDVTKRRGIRESAKESKRRHQQPLADTIKKERRKKKKRGTCGCGSCLLPTCYFIDRLHNTFYGRLCNFRNGLIRLSGIWYILTHVQKTWSRCCWCDVLLCNTFHGRLYNFRNGFFFFFHKAASIILLIVRSLLKKKKKKKKKKKAL